jgi:hypothetical protein
MRLRYFTELLLLGSAVAQNTIECPTGLSIVKVQPEVVVELQPVTISSVFSTNTVLTVGGTMFPITGAPTTFVTSFTVTETRTRFLTG